MGNEAINLQEKLTKIDDYWSPKIVAQMNDYQVKVAKVQGEFVWHNHADTDELFLILRGRLRIELEEGPVTLDEGDLYVVPAGEMHRPVAEEECHLLLVEPAGTINTGDAGSELTAADGQWI